MSVLSLVVRRVLSRLEEAERQESNPHFQDDFRIAWITVLYAATGVEHPHVVATYRVLGLHPDKVWNALVERRKRALGSAYDDFFGGASSPKKPVQSVREWPRRKSDAA